MPDFTPLQWAVVGTLVSIQIVLLAASLTSLARTQNERLTLPRIAWILICFIQIVGPIAFLAAGRKPAPHIESEPSPRSQAAVESVIDELYPKS